VYPEGDYGGCSYYGLIDGREVVEVSELPEPLFGQSRVEGYPACVIGVEICDFGLEACKISALALGYTTEKPCGYDFAGEYDTKG
jgi:hypothetical protein